MKKRKRIVQSIIAIGATLLVIASVIYYLNIRMEEREEQKETLTLIVEVPQNTPKEDTVFVELDSKQKKMNRISMYKWSINLTAKQGEIVHYRYNRNALGFLAAEEYTPDSEEKRRVLTVERLPMTKNDRVEKWRWLPTEPFTGYNIPEPPASVPTRLDNGSFTTGVALIDYFTPEFIPLINSTMDRVGLLNANMILLAQVYAITQIDPLAFGDLGNTMSNDSLAQHITKAKEMGLNVTVSVFFDEGFINNIHQQLLDNLSETWLDNFFAQFNQLLSSKLQFLSDLEVDTLIIPAHSFYHANPNLLAYVNSKIIEQISLIRENFSGQLTSDIEMGEPFDYYQYLDYITTIWDPKMSAKARTDIDFTLEMQTLLNDYYLSLYEKYEKPILLIAGFGSHEGAAQQVYSTEDPRISPYFPDTDEVALDLQVQIDLYAASLRVFAQRPWIKGVVIFGYSYWDSVDKDVGVRGKPAEQLLRDWFQALN